MNEKTYEPLPEALAAIPQQPFQFNVGTFPTLAVRSRRIREGRYGGKRSGKHYRASVGRWWGHAQDLLSIRVKVLNRKQRKQAKMSEGEM